MLWIQVYYMLLNVYKIHLHSLSLHVNTILKSQIHNKMPLLKNCILLDIVPFLVLVDSVVGFPGGSIIKNMPAMQEMRIISLDWKDPLEKAMATCSSILSGKSHGQRILTGYCSWSCKRGTRLSE